MGLFNGLAVSAPEYKIDDHKRNINIIYRVGVW